MSLRLGISCAKAMWSTFTSSSVVNAVTVFTTLLSNHVELMKYGRSITILQEYSRRSMIAHSRIDSFWYNSSLSSYQTVFPCLEGKTTSLTEPSNTTTALVICLVLHTKISRSIGLKQTLETMVSDGCQLVVLVCEELQVQCRQYAHW